MRIHLSALGCRLNEAELEQWATDFERAGDEVATTAEEADVLVMNTCAVTREAVRKSRQRVQKLQRTNPEAKLVVSGCYSSLESPAALAELGVDLVVPNTDKDRLVRMTRDAFLDRTMPESATRPAEAALFRRNRHRAFIKIQDGCRYRCTFCIVTVARGEERSRAESDIVAEVQRLHESGVQEVVLTGVHVGGYGSDTGTDLQQLVRTLLKETDVPRLRFASVEPWDLPPDFLHLFENQRVQPHMHLPLQSGSDSVLRRMARRCKTAEFERLVGDLRHHVPGFNVTTDIIVGFPGETEDEWRQSVDFIEAMEFGHIHIFSYSEREGTKAARLPDPVPKAVRQSRNRELHEIAARQRHKLMQAQVGQHVPVLWERAEAVPGGFRHHGYTPNYLRVSTVNSAELANRIVDTRLAGVEDGLLLGEIDSASLL